MATALRKYHQNDSSRIKTSHQIVIVESSSSVWEEGTEETEHHSVKLLLTSWVIRHCMGMQVLHKEEKELDVLSQ
ncbi:hypothetical protein TNCT_92401 [Trichonephila clavata]|uniref:Uncharacterized protein n=1 Tax=Trichonephila clavata TaxID=2740835 RepID=A0A8X6GI16_TRICU|nr:hypothetical protein TNCT_92401 [Trichonephila clavata]